jgi:hypothetical protein
MRDPDGGRPMSLVLVLWALFFFALLWLAIDSNMFSSVHGAP